MEFWVMLQSIMGVSKKKIMGCFKQNIMGWWVPPPPRCGKTENITFPHPSDAGGN